jgi:hypothetical protein
MDADQNVVIAWIVNYLQSSEYRIGPGGPPVTLQPNSDAQRDALAKIISSISATSSARRQAAALIQGQAGQIIRWANFSPDGRLVLAGFEDPSVGVMTSATVFRVSDLTPILRVRSQGFIRDSLWLQDSKILAILESTERMKMTPWGLLSALSGHPIQLQTYYIRWLDVDSRSDIRVKITDGVENGEGELHLSPNVH